jgi:hypothetical protein
MANKEHPTTPQSQSDKELAHELETDDSEERLDERLRKIAKSPPPKDGKPDKGKPAK